MISIFFQKKNFFKKIIEIILFKRSNFGPGSVLNNLVEGLKKNKILFNVNPSLKNIYDISLVLSGIDLLKKNIFLKKK